MSGIATEKVSPGQGKAIRIPSSIFSNIRQPGVAALLPPLTVARRKKRIVSPEASAYIQKNKMILKAESAGEKILVKRNESVNISARSQGSVPRYGSEACCAKGCNGCLIFWHDKRFEKSREGLRKKAIGEKLKTS